MNLVIDIGNTQAKVAVFDNGNIVESIFCPYSEILEQIQLLDKQFLIRASIVSNVSKNIPELDNFLSSKYFHITLNKEVALPIEILYQTPETLGVDRRALSVAAWSMNSQGNSLVIDMGSCITYDFVQKGGKYLGGAISPGANMRFRAMNNFTASLPLVQLCDVDFAIGTNTEKSLQSGVVNGVIAEINSYIRQIEKKYGEIHVFLTGGEHAFFVNKLKSSIFADPSILLNGLNIILEYNLKNDNEV